jgi:pteridine reductase
MTKAKKTCGTALVTGSAKRIGRAICQSLVKLGYRIALHYYRSFEDAKKLAAEIRQEGGRVELFPCDLSNENTTSQLIDQIHSSCPDLNLLINNASVFHKSNLKTGDLKSFHQHFDTNFKAPYILTRDFAQYCQNGHIINILDTHIVQNKTNYFTYLLSKKALAELTKMAALQLAPDIRVNAIAPGLILQPKREPSEYLNRLAQKIPLKEKGDISQITKSVEFLIENTYLTGQIIFNDGGEHLL